MELNYGTHSINVNVLYSERKRFSVTVYADFKITAKAPLHCTKEAILHHLSKRASWIVRQLDFFKQYQPIRPDRKYISGETYYYLGRQYRLKIIESESKHSTPYR